MKGMIIDPDQLKRFCDELVDTVKSLEEQLRKTEQAMEDVHNEWKDYQFEKYKTEFDKDKDEIRPLCEILNEYESDVLYPLYKIAIKYHDLNN